MKQGRWIFGGSGSHYGNQSADMHQTLAKQLLPGPKEAVMTNTRGGPSIPLDESPDRFISGNKAAKYYYRQPNNPTRHTENSLTSNRIHAFVKHMLCEIHQNRPYCWA